MDYIPSSLLNSDKQSTVFTVNKADVLYTSSQSFDSTLAQALPALQQTLAIIITIELPDFVVFFQSVVFAIALVLLQQQIILPSLLTVYESIIRFHYLHSFSDQLWLIRFVRVVWEHQGFVRLADFWLRWRRWGVQVEYFVVVFHLPISPIQQYSL